MVSLGHGVVVRVAHAVDRGLNAGLLGPVRVVQRHVLDSAVRMDRLSTLIQPSGVQRAYARAGSNAGSACRALYRW